MGTYCWKSYEIRFTFPFTEEANTYYGCNIELLSFYVALFEKLRGHQFGNSFLNLPRLRDGGQIANRHQHRPQQFPMLVQRPTSALTHDTEKRSAFPATKKILTKKSVTHVNRLPEIHSQICGQYCFFEYPNYPRIFVRGYIRKQLVAGRIQDHYALVKMVVLHRRGRIQLCQRGRSPANQDKRRLRVEDGAVARKLVRWQNLHSLYLKGVISSPVVQVVAEATDHEGEAFDFAENVPPLRGLNGSENKII